MFPIEFILLALFTTRTSARSQLLAKCCPPGHIFSGTSDVECVSVSNSTKQLYVLQRNATEGFQGLPRCDEPENIATMPFNSFGSGRLVQVPACLEILHDQETGDSNVTIVYCRSNGARQAIDASLSQLVQLRKCCPRDAVFDGHTKACVSWSNKSLATFLPNGSADVDFVLIATEGPPTCEGPIVDYEIDQDDVFLRNDTYSVIVPAFKNNSTEELPVNEDNACLEMTPDTASNRKLIARVCRPPEFCDGNPCIRKCCAEDTFFYGKGCYKFPTPEEPKEFHRTFASTVNQTESFAFNASDDYGVLIGNPCRYGTFLAEEKWFITSEGHISLEDYPIQHHNEYCMDIFYNNSIASFDRDIYLILCFGNPQVDQYRQIRFRVNTALEIISCAFLLITLLVYACLPSLQNLHGKTLMCHVGSLFLAFICLTIITCITSGKSSGNEEKKADVTCKTLAYTMLFCFLSSFSWLNVMCFDIWWTFGILRGSMMTKARRHRKKFLLYCLYAWGISFLVSILAIVADWTDILPDYLQPDIGNRRCWFTRAFGSYGELTFFIGPVTILLMANIVFFVLTLVHCNKVKAEIKRMTTDPADPRSKRFHSDRIRFIMNVKLFIVMGISWTCEIVSFFLKKYLEDVTWHQMLFYVSDVFNLLQGLLIFILFVLKSRVYQALRKRLGLDSDKKPNPTCNATTLQDPYRVRKSASNSTLTTTFAISSAP